MYPQNNVWIIPSFLIWGYVLHVEHISCLITNCGHPFSSLNSSLGLTGGKYHQKIIFPIIRLILQNYASPGCFPILISIAIFSPYFLLVGLLLQYVSLGNWLSIREFVNWCRVAISNDKSTSWVPSLFVVVIFYSPFLKLFVARRLCVIDVKEYDYFHVFNHSLIQNNSNRKGLNECALCGTLKLNNSIFDTNGFLLFISLSKWKVAHYGNIIP